MDDAEINVCWLRRDLRLNDNAALYHALKLKTPVLLFFIFDKNILDKLSNRADPRVTFIYTQLENLNKALQPYGSSLLVSYGDPLEAWEGLTEKFNISNVFLNADYEPYATLRDAGIHAFLKRKAIGFNSFKDHVVFEKNEIIKQDGKPYTVFTPYYRKWLTKLNDFYIRPYPSENLQNNLLKFSGNRLPELKALSFKKVPFNFPRNDFEQLLRDYEGLRNYPAADATTRIGLHLRFGTLSIRAAVRAAIAQNANKWLSELAWRDFYMMIIWHFPGTTERSFKPAYDNIMWRNNEVEFEAWCNGKTGYPIVDAGMRQLNATGFMHNRVRMIVASFLTKHLLIDWRWGAAYFAEKLLDFELASNIGGWQWAAGSGNDAAPYFRIFNPIIQTKKFDPDLKYIKKWVPEFGTDNYGRPIVEHSFARERALRAYKTGLSNTKGNY